MNTEIIREALTEAKEAMMWELGGEPIWSLTAAARLKIEEALAALDDAKVPCLDRYEAAQLMELMDSAIKGETLVLLGRLSEQKLYNKLVVLAGNK